jgi:hypothetical protein
MCHPSPTLPRSIININVATTRHPTTPTISTIDPSSPLVPPAFPLKSPSPRPISPLKTKRPLKAIVGQSSKRLPPSTTVKIAFHLVTLDTSPCEEPLVLK